MRTCSLFGSVRKRSVRLTRVLTCSALAAGLYSNNVHAGSFCNGLTQPWRSIPSSPSSTRRQAGRLSQDLLVMQNFCSTNSIIEYFKSESRFMKLAKLEQDALEARDRKDAQFLADGVQQAIEEGLLAQLEETPAYEDIDVMSMTPNQCAEFIASKLPRDGAVVVVVGGSGTGKQTTVNELMKLLPSAVAWSNGDCFRSLTMLAIAHSKQSGERITDCLTSQNLDTWAGMLEVTTEGDVLIKGCGIDEKVSEIKNTLLKDPGLEELLPKVASLSQATVLGFARRASEKLSTEEGRWQEEKSFSLMR